jgi:hypothetical protein
VPFVCFVVNSSRGRNAWRGPVCFATLAAMAAKDELLILCARIGFNPPAAAA